MDKGKKRDRSVNFTWKETERLVRLVKGKKHIIENKKSDAETWKQKEATWKAVEKEFNSSSDGVYRDAKHLKSKYEALKRDTRKKFAQFRAQHHKMSSGAHIIPHLTPVEEKLKDMILFSVEGCENTCDSDQSTTPGNCNKDIQHKESPAANWNQSTLFKTQKCSKLSKRKSEDKRMFARLIEIKQEVALLQKNILEQEYIHKKRMNELEQKKILLKIEILNKELQKQ